MFRHLSRVIRAWLYPLKSMEAWQGWASVLYLAFVFIVPITASVATALSQSIRAGLWTLAAFLALLLALALVALWRANPYPEPTAEFSVGDEHHRLRVVVRKGGKGLPNAAILLTVPAAFGHLSKLGTPDHRYVGPADDGSIVWDELSVFIAGGGSHPTTWDFRTTVPPGDHPITLTISDDTLPRATVISTTLHVPVTDAWKRQPEEARSHELNWLAEFAERLRICRELFTDSLGTAHWDPRVRLSEYHRRGQQRAFVGILDEEDVETVNAAFDAFDRISQVYVPLLNQRRQEIQAQHAEASRRAHKPQEQDGARQAAQEAPQRQPDVSLVPDDGIEAALVTTIDALGRVKRKMSAAQQDGPDST